MLKNLQDSEEVNSGTFEDPKHQDSFEEPKVNPDLNYYEILGVSTTATAEEIKSRYREVSLKFHPDKEVSSLSEEMMKQINEAYDTLKDVDKRRRYDSELDSF